jgi:hypothetical protein
MFVVRDDSRHPELLYQAAVTTYQAYNNYPNDGATGKSLYEAGKAPSYGANTIAGTPRAVKVSFDRPYSSNGDGEFLKWEAYQVRWMERMGYDVAYTTDVDTHASPSRLLDAKGFVTAGHDEYWSKAMYDGVEAARGAGVGVAIFGANSTYFQIRFEPSTSGAPNRVVACYKDQSIDPVQGATLSVRWRDAALNRPEQRLIGVQYTPSFDETDPYFAYVVQNAAHWIYAGTGLQNGDSIAGVVGYEVDRTYVGVPVPDSAPNTYVTLSQSPFVSSLDGLSTANSTMYQDSSGAWVFGAGTIGWSWGLDKAGVIDARLERTTANVLGAFTSGAGAQLPASPANVTAVADTPSHLNISWTDASNNESGFAVDVSANPDFTNVQTLPAPRNATSMSFPGASSGTTYYVRVRAVNALGGSAWSDVATVTTPSALAYRDIVMADGPIAFWRFGEASGSNAASETGIGAGTYNGGFVLGRPGAMVGDPNTSLALNGSTGYMSAPHSSPLNFGDAFSFEAWFMRTTLGTDQRLFFKGTGSAVVQLNTSNRIRFAKSGAGDIAYSSITLTDTSKWHHLVVTKNGSAVHIYIDGVDVTGTVTNLSFVNTTSAINIGRDPSGQYFNGGLDEVAVYGYALSPARVLAHYLAGTTSG